MDNKAKLMDTFKKIAAVAFIVSFIMGAMLVGKMGASYLSPITAKYIFIGSGAIALFFNLLSFDTGKNNPIFNFIYWIGSIVVFGGLVSLMMRWPYAMYTVIAGIALLGVSFLISPERKPKENRTDILDN